MLSINRVLFEKILLFMLAISWTSLPWVLYRQMSWDLMQAYHGYGLIPFFSPVIFILFGYFYSRTNFFLRSSNHLFGFLYMLKKKSTNTDIFFLIFMAYIFLNEALTSMSSFMVFEQIVPLIWGHIFYFLYKNFLPFSVINNTKEFFLRSIVICFLLMIFLQILMPDGVSREFSFNFIQGIIYDIKETPGDHQGYVSYSAVIFLFILTYYKKDINMSLIYTIFSYLSILYVLLLNQTRGALLPALILIVLFIISNGNIYKRIFLLISIVLSILIAIMLIPDNHRIFSIVDSSASERLMLMIESLNKILNKGNPLFGFGMNDFESWRFGLHQHIVHSYWFVFTLAYGLFGFFLLMFYYIRIFIIKFTFKNIIGLLVIGIMLLSDLQFYYSIYLLAALALTFKQDKFLFNNKIVNK